MRAVAPAVLFICLSAAVRGYCQGLRDMRPTAVSQLWEALGKLLFGLLFALLARRAGLPLPQIAAAGVLGLSAGTLLSLLYLLACLRAHIARERHESQEKGRISGQPKRPAQRVLRRLVGIALPITLSSGVLTLTRLLDMVLILRRLQSCGYTEAAANALYGAYSTMAIPLYALLPALVSAVALPLVPGITHAREVGDRAVEQEIVTSSFRLTLLLAFPAGLGLAAFAHSVLALLFGGESAVAVTAPLLAMLGVSVPGACLMTVTGAMLQAYRRPHLPLISMLFGAALKLTAAWLLLGDPRFGMLGAPLSTFLCNLLVVVLDLVFLYPLIPHDGKLSSFCCRVFAASLLSVGGVWALWRMLGARVALPRSAVLAAVALCALLYLLLAVSLGALRREDLARLAGRDRPRVVEKASHSRQGGEKVVDIHEKIG